MLIATFRVKDGNTRSIPNVHGIVLGLSAVILSVPYDMPRHEYLIFSLMLTIFLLILEFRLILSIIIFGFVMQLASRDCDATSSILERALANSRGSHENNRWFSTHTFWYVGVSKGIFYRAATRGMFEQNFLCHVFSLVLQGYKVWRQTLISKSVCVCAGLSKFSLVCHIFRMSQFKIATICYSWTTLPSVYLGIYSRMPFHQNTKQNSQTCTKWIQCQKLN